MTSEVIMGVLSDFHGLLGISRAVLCGIARFELVSLLLGLTLCCVPIIFGLMVHSIYRPFCGVRRIESGRRIDICGYVESADETIPALVPNEPECAVWIAGDGRRTNSRRGCRSRPIVLRCAIGRIRVLINPRELLVGHPLQAYTLSGEWARHTRPQWDAAEIEASHDVESTREYQARDEMLRSLRPTPSFETVQRALMIRPGDDVIIRGYFRKIDRSTGTGYRTDPQVLDTYFVEGDIPRAQRRGLLRWALFRRNLVLYKFTVAEKRRRFGVTTFHFWFRVVAFTYLVHAACILPVLLIWWDGGNARGVREFLGNALLLPLRVLAIDPTGWPL